MALTFVDWENATDGFNFYTLDWSSAANLRGKQIWLYIEALRQAVNERALSTGSISSSYYIAGPIPPGAVGVTSLAPLASRGLARQIDFQIDRLIEFAQASAGTWVDYSDSAGEWNGQISIPKLDTIAKMEAFIGESFVYATSGKTNIAEWAINKYKILNAMRWKSHREGDAVTGLVAAGAQVTYVKEIPIDPNTGKRETSVNWTSAEALFNSRPWISSATPVYASLAVANHGAEWEGGGPGAYEYFIGRKKFDGIVTNIPTEVNHQTVWYRWSNRFGPSGSFTYSNNDFVNSEATLWKIFTSGVGNSSSHTGFTVGDYNSGNTSVDEPVIQSDYYGYQLHNYPGTNIASNLGEVLMKWDVTDGFTFVN